MNNAHKIVYEIFKLPEKEMWAVTNILEAVEEARHEFKNVGVEFTYDGFKEFYKRKYAEHIKSSPDFYLPIVRIIDGDNLDAIEEAAKNKGLL